MPNGLFSIHVRLGDGESDKGSGVVMLRDGALRGGDAFLFYVGSYARDREGIRGEVIINQHTPSPGAFPLFGGAEVGIGFSGDLAPQGGTLEGVAFVRGRSLRFQATLRRLADLD